MFRFVYTLILLSVIISSPPKWINDVSDKKNWVGIGIVNKDNIPPGSDPAQSAFNNAVQSIASEISISIESTISEDLKDSLYIDENGNAVSVFSSSFKKSLSTKVKAKLDGVKKVKADNDGKNYYCKASLSMKKYWKDLKNRRDEAVEVAKANLDKVLTSDFDGSVFRYLDDALFEIFEFQGGVENDFVSFGAPEITISICPESGTKLTSDDKESASVDSPNEDKTKAEKEKESYLNKEKKKYDDIRLRSEQKLKEMRERISNYSNFGEKEEISNNDSDDLPKGVVPIPPDIDSKNNESSNKNSKEIKSRVKDKDLEKFGIVVATHTQIISPEEDDCKKCLNSNSCDNPFSEDCECSEPCGVAIAKEVCEEKTILLAPYIRQMLDDYLQRINLSGNDNKIEVKFGEKYDRESYRVTDSYLDKKSFKSLDELVAERESMVYRSPEWSKVQNLINQLLNNKKRHDDGIVSLPLYNIPLKFCVGEDLCTSVYSDKSGYFDIDFPKYIKGEDPYLHITVDSDFFTSYNPLFPPFLKIPIDINPMLINIEIIDINEWNDGLGYSLDSYLKQAFSDNKYSFTPTKSQADKFLKILSESEINEVGDDLFKVRHISSVSFSDETGVICEKVFKNKAKTCIGSSNSDLKNCATEAKKKLTKKFVKGLPKLEECILSK